MRRERRLAGCRVELGGDVVLPGGEGCSVGREGGSRVRDSDPRKLPAREGGGLRREPASDAKRRRSCTPRLAEPGRARIPGSRVTGGAGPARALRPACALSSSRMAQGDEGVASPAPANPELEKFQRWRSSPACRLEPPAVAEPCTWLQLVVAEDGSCSLGCRLCGARPPAPGRSAFADGTYKLRPDKRGGRRA